MNKFVKASLFVAASVTCAVMLQLLQGLLDEWSDKPPRPAYA